jgi:hypothetical protein
MLQQTVRVASTSTFLESRCRMTAGQPLKGGDNQCSHNFTMRLLVSHPAMMTNENAQQP